MNKSLNEWRDAIWENAEKKGFHERNNFGEKLMLVVSELGEALEADRDDKWLGHGVDYERIPFDSIRGTVEEELIDAIIRILDICGIYKVDVDELMKRKFNYNIQRPPLHGRKYG